MSARAWISQQDVARLTGWTPRTIYRKAAVGELKTRTSPTAGPNGRAPREYSVLSLPPETQKQILSRGLSCAETNDETDVTNVTLPLFDHPSRVALASPAAQAQADKRHQAIQPLLDFCRRPTTLQVGNRKIANADQFAQYLAEQNGVSARTLWRWVALYKKSGFAALADSTRGDKGKSLFFESHVHVGAFAENKYLVERVSIRLVHEAIMRDWETLRLDADDAPPSYDTVRTYLNALPRALTVLAREGDRQYKERIEIHLIKQYTDRAANEVWVSDHCIHDVWVRNDGVFSDVPFHAALRPWLTAIIDYRSRKAVGFTWCATPSSNSISAALRAAILAYGPCKEFYVDNGKDYATLGRIAFGKSAPGAVAPEASGVLVRLGIATQHCTPRHPQAKHIESWFATMHKRFDALFRPFYAGTSPKDRPEECDAALKQHQLALKEGRPESSKLPLASEFVQLAAQWIEDYNSTHEHSGRGMKGQTPDEVFNAGYPLAARPQVDPRSLDELLWKRETRRVREGGRIELFRQIYEPADPQSFAALFLQTERDVLVACDPYNLGDAIALDLDGKFLGALRCEKLMAHGPTSVDDVRASIRQRRMVKRTIKDYVESLRVQRAGDRSELQVLRDSAGVGSPTPKSHRLLPAARARAAAEPVRFVEDIATEFCREEED